MLSGSRPTLRCLKPLAIAAIGLFIAVTQQAQADTGLVMDSPAGDYIGGGQSYYFTPENGTFSAQKDFDNGISVIFSNSGSPSQFWRLEFSAPGNALLAPGTYTDARRDAFHKPSEPGLSVSGNGRGCNQSTGSFTVHQVVYGTGNTIVAFDASFSQSCENTMPPLTGRVLFNSTNSLPPANRITSELAVFTTAGQPFRYQVRTSKPNDSFTAENLPPGLTIDAPTGLISGTTTAPGNYQVTLSASGSNGTATATLDLTVDPPGWSTGLHNALEMISEPGDYIGGGKTTSLRSSDGRFVAYSFSPNSVEITFEGPNFSPNWRLRFSAPTGSTLGVGNYQNVGSSSTSTQAGLRISGNGRAGSSVTGSFEVKEIGFDSSGRVKNFHASFIHRNDGSQAALIGSVWYQSTKAITSRLAAAGREGEPFSYQIIANNRPQSYSATGLPTGLTLDPETGLISGTPRTSGRFGVNIGATGAEATAAEVLDLRINPAQALVNVSTRLKVGTGNNVVVGGFIITGQDPKRVIVRAIGPSLEQSGVANVLADPNLEIYAEGQLIGKNDDWRTTQLGGRITENQRAEILATGIPPTADVESAVVLTLQPGAYTAVVRGFAGSVGVGLVEVFDLSQPSDSRLANISTRGFVQTGDNVMIGGFLMGGKTGTGGRVIVRALGPSLAASGVSNVLADPTLELYDSQGVLLAANNDWKDSQEAEIESLELAPSKPTESAILTTLPLGGFTAIVRGKGDTSGNALVEVYSLP